MYPAIGLRKFAISFAMFALIALSSAAVARADQAVISVPNPGLSGSPGPYATVTYVLNGSVIDVTVTMNAGFAAFGTGNGNNGIFGFNIVGSTAGLNVTNLVGISGFNAAGGQMDGVGNFDVTLHSCNPGGVFSRQRPEYRDSGTSQHAASGLRSTWNCRGITPAVQKEIAKRFGANLWTRNHVSAVTYG